jgi:ferrous iron transport protein B
MVVALNMYDRTQKRGDHIDPRQLSQLFAYHGSQCLPQQKSRRSFKVVIEAYEGTEDLEPHFRHIHINHGHEIENGISEIQEHLKKESDLRGRYSTRYLAIKLLERDKVEHDVRQLPMQRNLPASLRGRRKSERRDT